jgi:FkbM family methyltransferase
MKPKESLRYLIVSYFPNQLTSKRKVSYFKIIGLIGSIFQERQRIIQVEDFAFKDGNIIWKICCTDGIVYIPTLARLSRFIWGIDYALNRLATQYGSTDEDIDSASYIVDGGANIGEYAWWAMKKGAAGAILIEPDKKNLACARLNLRKYEHKIEYLETALSKISGVSKFYFSKDSANSSMYINDSLKENPEIEMVKTITLDQVFSTYLKGFKYILKLDAEGHEPEVIQGGRQFFKHASMFSIDVSAERNLESTQRQVEELFFNFKVPIKVIATENSRIIIRRSL